ncbi:MAG: MarR family transcriptional regulator [Clostridia bacterium]|nr:MarR family transcriptional regulator [Clostridia bacterium]
MTPETDIYSFGRNVEIFADIIKTFISQSISCPEQNVQVTLGQLKCLQFIYAHEKVHIGDIARNRGISYPAATKIITRLEEKGLVLREHDPSDRRNTFVSLTECGQLLATQILPDKIQRMKELLAKIPPEKLSALQEGISAFLEVSLADQELLEQYCLHCGKDHDETCLICEIKLRITQANV